MNDKRLQQILDYAQALKVMAEHGRGNLKDTADIVKALEELQAYQEFGPELNAGPPLPKRNAQLRKPQPRKAA